MDDILAKELHDAGYPAAAPHGDGYRMPSLEELIAACPKDAPGDATFVLGSGKGGQSWTATYFNFRTNRLTQNERLVQTAATPTEAVARLWLALNAHGR